MPKKKAKKSRKRHLTAAQMTFDGKDFIKPNGEFGGSKLKSNPKGKRPLSTKLPIHLTLRAGKSVLRLPRTFAIVNQAIETTAEKYGVKIYRSANVGNHCHLLIKIPSLRLWAPFIRELTGRIAQAVMAMGVKLKNFWLYRPHTRIVAGWGRAYRIMKDYIGLNQLDADGFISRRDMKTLTEYREFLRLVSDG